MPLLFEKLEFINLNTYEVLKRLSEKYQIIIASIGHFDNISLKSQWVKNNLPFITEAIFLVNQGCKMSKELISMVGKGNVFIDDVASNLNSIIEVEKRICFGRIRSWNEQWNGERCFNWTEVAEKLL